MTKMLQQCDTKYNQIRVGYPSSTPATSHKTFSFSEPRSSHLLARDNTVCFKNLRVEKWFVHTFTPAPATWHFIKLVSRAL